MRRRLMRQLYPVESSETIRSFRTCQRCLLGAERCPMCTGNLIRVDDVMVIFPRFGGRG